MNKLILEIKRDGHRKYHATLISYPINTKSGDALKSISQWLNNQENRKYMSCRLVDCLGNVFVGVYSEKQIVKNAKKDKLKCAI